MPVLLGNELFDFAFPIGDQLQRDRLHPPGTETAPYLVPQQRADLVADEPIQDPACALRRHHLLVNGSRVEERLLNGLFRDFVEGQAGDFPFASGELLRQVPADGLALAIRVGRHVDVRGFLGRVLQLLDDLLPRRD